MQLTFTEDEVKKVAAFVQIVYDKAEFKSMTTKECIAIPRLIQFMQDHIKKMDAHIFELKQVRQSPEKKKTTKKKATKKKAK